MDYPPTFWDLPKDISNLFTTGYFRNVLKLEVKTKTKSGIKFHFGGERSLRIQDFLAFLEAEYEFKEYGVTFTENWNTDNVLATGVTVEDWIKGVKLTCETSLFPADVSMQPRDRSSVLSDLISPANSSRRQISRPKWNYSDRMLRIETLYRNSAGCLSLESVFSTSRNPDLLHDLSGPLIKCGAVLNWRGLMLGCGIGADVGTRSLFDCVLGAHFENNIFTFNGFVSNARVVSTSLSQRFLDGDFEAGVAGLWSLDDPAIREFAVACKWKQDEDTTFRLKLDNFKLVGLGISQRIRKGVTFLLSVMANGCNLLNGDWYQDYQFGACLELGEDDEL